MKRVCVFGLAALAIAATSASAQDNPEGPWGAFFGGNYATGRSATLPIIFEPGDEIEVAWEFDAHAEWGMWGLKGRQQIVFDATGNLYWQCGDYWWLNYGRLVSLDSDGNLRWTFAGSDGAGLGWRTTHQTPIVGSDAVYVASFNIPIYDESDPPVHVGDKWMVYAVDKSDGSEIWATQLNNEPAAKDGCCWKTNITLLNGKIYAIGVPHDDNTRAIYVLDAATGAVLHNQRISGLPEVDVIAETNILAIEDVFGEGVDGLYGTWYDEVYCVGIDIANPANTTLEWEVPVGPIPWYAEKHVIYAEEVNMILTYGFNDAYGYEVFALDPEFGDLYTYEWGDAGDDGDSGYFQSGALGFYDDVTETMPMYTGAWPGRVLEYSVLKDDGVTYVGPYNFNEGWGTIGNYIQVLQNPTDEHRVLVTSGAGVPSPILMIDLDGDMTKAPEGPMYIDDVKVYAGPDTANLTLVYSDDFEGYTPGSIIGQGGWADASESGSAEGPSLVVVDPIDANNQVVEISPEIGVGSWEGIQQTLSLPDTNVYRVEYRQYLVNWSQAIYMALTDNPDGDHGCPFSANSDYTGKMFALAWENEWTANTYMVENAWESIVITHDYIGEQSEVVVGGTKSDVASWLEEGSPKWCYPTSKPTGFAIQLIDTATSNNVPSAIIVNYDVENTAAAYLDQQVSGGPLVGPDGKIYYGINDDGFIGDEPRAGRIYALQPKSDDVCADANCDKAVNAFDIDPFVIALVAPATWEATYSCDMLATCDVNGDGAVNAFDIDPFVVALVNGGCQ